MSARIIIGLILFFILYGIAGHLEYQDKVAMQKPSHSVRLASE